MPPALQFLVLTFAGWVNRHQDDLIDYLREENRVLREHLGPRPLRLTDAQRRRLAVRGHKLGRRVLTQVARQVDQRGVSHTRGPARRGASASSRLRVHRTRPSREKPPGTRQPAPATTTTSAKAGRRRSAAGTPRRITQFLQSRGRMRGRPIKRTLRGGHEAREFLEPVMVELSRSHRLSFLLGTIAAQHVRDRAIPFVTRILEERLLHCPHGHRCRPGPCPHRRVRDGDPVVDRVGVDARQPLDHSTT